MGSYYKLEGMIPVPCINIIDWAIWFETADRHVALDKFDDVKVSTVFLGIDHNYEIGKPPLLFETMVFASKHPEIDELTERYTTWEEAVVGHNRIVEEVKESLQ